MVTLPWLLANGALLGWCLLVAASLLGLGLGHRLRRGRARRYRRAALGALGPASSLAAAVDGQPMVLRGRLRLLGADPRGPGGRLAETIAPLPRRPTQAGYPLAVSAPAPVGLALEVEGALVPIADPIEVLAGSTEETLGRLDEARRRPTTQDAGALSLLLGQEVELLGLGEGDLIRARGVLRQHACDERPMGYRDNAARWVLTGEPRPLARGLIDSSRVAAAFEGKPRLSEAFPRALARAALSTSTMALVALGALSLLGWLGLTILERDGAPADLDLRGGAPLAALSPLHHQRAIDLITERLQRERPGGPFELNRLAELRRLGSGCAAEAWTLAREGAFEQAAAAGRACPDRAGRQVAAEALYALGRFEEGSALVDTPGGDERCLTSPFEARLHLLGGDLARAERAASRCVARLRLEAASSRDRELRHLLSEEELEAARQEAASLRARAQTYECLAGALAAGRGDRRARDLLLRRARRNPACRLLAADQVSGPARLELLDLPNFGNLSGREERAALLLSAEVPDAEVNLGLLAPPDARAELLVHPERFLGGTSPALERSALDALDRVGAPSRPVRLNLQRLRTRQAQLELVAGRHESALRLLGEVRDELHPGGSPSADDADDERSRDRSGDLVALMALVELDRGRVDQAQQLLASPLVRRRLSTEGIVALASCRERGLRCRVLDSGDDRFLGATTRGDGVAMVEVLRSRPWLTELARHWAPRIRSGRAALRRHLRWADRGLARAGPSWLLYLQALSRRSAAQNLGDRPRADDLDAVVARFEAALGQRETALALLVLDGLDAATLARAEP